MKLNILNLMIAMSISVQHCFIKLGTVVLIASTSNEFPPGTWFLGGFLNTFHREFAGSFPRSPV